MRLSGFDLIERMEVQTILMWKSETYVGSLTPILMLILQSSQWKKIFEARDLT